MMKMATKKQKLKMMIGLILMDYFKKFINKKKIKMLTQKLKLC